MAIFKQKFL